MSVMITKADPSNDSWRSKGHEDKLAVLMTASLFTFPFFWLIHHLFRNRNTVVNMVVCSCV